MATYLKSHLLALDDAQAGKEKKPGFDCKYLRACSIILYVNAWFYYMNGIAADQGSGFRTEAVVAHCHWYESRSAADLLSLPA